MTRDMWGERKNDELLGGAGLADAVDGEVGAGDSGAFGQVPELRRVEVGGRMRVDDLAALFAVEMDVLVQVRAVTGLSALEVDKLDQPGRGEVLKTIINRGKGHAGRSRLHSVENLVGRGVIRGGGKDIEDLPTVRRQTHIGSEHSHPALKAGGLGRRAIGGGGHDLELE